MQSAELPAVEPGFAFDAILEFGYLSNNWCVPGAFANGAPAKGVTKVTADVAKVGRQIAAGVCGVGYVVVFEECDWGFPSTFVHDAEAEHRCRVRFIRDQDPA